jgi:hypothetical protein
MAEWEDESNRKFDWKASGFWLPRFHKMRPISGWSNFVERGSGPRGLNSLLKNAL